MKEEAAEKRKQLATESEKSANVKRQPSKRQKAASKRRKKTWQN